mmetsp:Transcript_34441/g.64210  ORF Transcript_34441/g.64210 Transcript_34441/m.64210 type:complete len:166 (+) Transcript_34441:130-627(+)
MGGYGYGYGSSVSVSNYTQAAWFISDVGGSRVVYASSFSESMRCLSNGDYIFRATGAVDAASANVSWSFCGLMVDVEEELLFSVAEGVCTPVLFGGSCSSGSHLPSGAPTASPSVLPSNQPVGNNEGLEEGHDFHLRKGRFDVQSFPALAVFLMVLGKFDVLVKV